MIILNWVQVASLLMSCLSLGLSTGYILGRHRAGRDLRVFIDLIERRLDEQIKRFSDQETGCGHEGSSEARN